MKLIVIYVRGSFYVIPYLTWKWFEIILCYNFYKFTSGYSSFPSNLKDKKPHYRIIHESDLKLSYAI